MSFPPSWFLRKLIALSKIISTTIKIIDQNNSFNIYFNYLKWPMKLFQGKNRFLLNWIPSENDPFFFSFSFEIVTSKCDWRSVGTWVQNSASSFMLLFRFCSTNTDWIDPSTVLPVRLKKKPLFYRWTLTIIPK